MARSFQPGLLMSPGALQPRATLDFDSDHADFSYSFHVLVQAC